MPTFGLSAFIKLVCLNPKPMKRELQKRLLGGSGRPYDFHRSLKLRGRKLIVDGVPLPELLEAAAAVSNLSERKSLIAGLGKLAEWRAGVTGSTFGVSPKTYESPRKLFKIAVQPQFGLASGPFRTAFHLWNTKTPDLKAGVVYGTLALLPLLYETDEPGFTDFGLLSLLEPRAYMLSRGAEIASDPASMIYNLEERILEIYDEYGTPPSPPQDPPLPPGRS